MFVYIKLSFTPVTGRHGGRGEGVCWMSLSKWFSRGGVSNDRVKVKAVVEVEHRLLHTHLLKWKKCMLQYSFVSSVVVFWKILWFFVWSSTGTKSQYSPVMHLFDSGLWQLLLTQLNFSSVKNNIYIFFLKTQKRKISLNQDIFGIFLDSICLLKHLI